MGDDTVKMSNQWLDSLSKGNCHQMEAFAMEGLKVLQSHKGFVRCRFVVNDRISDPNGNWHVGAIATMIDNVGAAAIYSLVGHIKASLDFCISYFSTAKIKEEVEIEAKVVGNKGRISSVMVEVRRTDNGDLIALAKQWMAAHNNAKILDNVKMTSKI